MHKLKPPGSLAAIGVLMSLRGKTVKSQPIVQVLLGRYHPCGCQGGCSAPASGQSVGCSGRNISGLSHSDDGLSDEETTSRKALGHRGGSVRSALNCRPAPSPSTRAGTGGGAAAIRRARDSSPSNAESCRFHLSPAAHGWRLWASKAVALLLAVGRKCWTIFVPDTPLFRGWVWRYCCCHLVFPGFHL